MRYPGSTRIEIEGEFKDLKRLTLEVLAKIRGDATPYYIMSATGRLHIYLIEEIMVHIQHWVHVVEMINEPSQQ